MEKKSRKKRRTSVDWVVGKIALLLTIFMGFIFLISVCSTKLLPVKFLAVIALALILVAFLVGLLTWKSKYRGRYIVGLLFAVLMCVVYGFGTSYVFRGLSTAKEITTVRTESAAVGIYVRADDQNDYAQVAGTYSYGILSQQDRENTNEAIRQIEDEYGTTLKTQEYDGLALLIDGILGGQVDAIIMNSAYLDLLSEMEGYEDAAQQLKEVQVTHVVREVQEEPSQEPEIPEDRLVGNTGENDATNAADEEQQNGKIFTVFISGIDNRGALVEKSRSDVNILASVNTETKQVVLISTPRDYYVPLSISGGANDKLTHAGIYGVDVCMDTLTMLYNVNVDYYFRVNFAGFEDIIDALGGVTVNSEQSFSTENYSFQAGDNTMNGKQALEFVRERHAFASGDRQRGKNQLALMKAVINKALSPELLMNYNSLLSALQGSFETSIPYDTVSDIVREQLDQGGDWNVVSYSVDGTGSSQVTYSQGQKAYVMVPDESTVETAKSLIAQVYNGETVTAP